LYGADIVPTALSFPLTATNKHPTALGGDDTADDDERVVKFALVSDTFAHIIGICNASTASADQLARAVCGCK